MKTRLLAISYFMFLALVVYCADSRAHLHLFSFIRSIPGGDKVGHFLFMGMLALLLNLALACRVVRVAGRTFLIGTIVALTLITIEEISQRFIPYRTFDLVDLIADYSGVIIFSALAVVIRRNYYGPQTATDLHT